MMVKIALNDPRYNYSYKGFCSIVCAIIDIALEHYSVYDDCDCQVVESQTLELFDSIHKGESEYDAGSWWLERFFSNELHHSEYSAHTVANPSNLILKNMIFQNILSIKKDKLLKFENKYESLGLTDKTLAVQIRGTDKNTEIEEPNINNIINKIDSYFESNLIDNIFLATDDSKFFNKLKSHYGDLLLYDNEVRMSEDGTPLHRLSDRDVVNEEVLSNVYILSRCKHFLYSFSNVSLLALIMGANTQKTIVNLNS
jgi:hypothetical protein